MAQKKNLLLAFDAFGTLFTPKNPVPEQYGYFAARHGIKQSQWQSLDNIQQSFRKAIKDESKRNPNYGRATGLGAERWWANIITKTFEPFLESGQIVPKAMLSDLLTQFSTSRGYDLYPDVLPFFKMLQHRQSDPTSSPWPWNRTVVGIITNSDSRVPGILESFGLKIGSRRFGDAAVPNTAVEEEDISFVMLSYDVGHEKPDRRIFDAAVDILKDEGMPIGDFEKLYVGDDYEKDFLGARNAGWDALMLKREGNIGTDEIGSFEELSNWRPGREDR